MKSIHVSFGFLTRAKGKKYMDSPSGSFFRFWSFVKVFSAFSGLLGFNHISSILIFKLCGLSIISMIAVYILCFSSLVLFWCGFKRAQRDRGTRQQRHLLKELYSIEVEKIPMIIDRFLELYGGSPRGEEEIYTKDSASCWVEKRCAVCLEAEACIQTLPCEHVVVCSWCAWQSLKLAFLQKSSHRCVVCRTEIEDFSRSLISASDLLNPSWKDVRKIVEDVKRC